MVAQQSTTDWSIVGLTAVLVVVTAFYAWTNRQALREMALAREQGVLPKLAIRLDPVGPLHSKLRLVNVGLGAARDVRVVLHFDTVDDDLEGPTRTWRTNVLAPGEFAAFNLPDVPGGGGMDNRGFVDTHRCIRLTGDMKDVLGKEHAVNEIIEDLVGWWTVVTESHQSLPQDRLAEIAKAINRLAK
jgi:hypothetical protein